MPPENPESSLLWRYKVLLFKSCAPIRARQTCSLRPTVYQLHLPEMFVITEAWVALTCRAGVQARPVSAISAVLEHAVELRVREGCGKVTARLLRA